MSATVRPCSTADTSNRTVGQVLVEDTATDMSVHSVAGYGGGRVRAVLETDHGEH